MTDQLNESVNTDMEDDLEVDENEDLEGDDEDLESDADIEGAEEGTAEVSTEGEKKPRKPRTTNYYGIAHDGSVLTFHGTREGARQWASDELPQYGLHEIAFFHRRSFWWLLVTGAGAGEHQIEGDVENVPGAILAAFEASGGKSVPVGTRRPRSKYKFEAQTKLERHVLKWAKGTGDVVASFSKILTDGASSGEVSHLVTPEQTTKFYRKYRIEISLLISDAIRNGLIKNAGDFDGWDSSDPLAQKETNQSVLAWFGFEMSAKNLCERAGVPEVAAE